MVTNGYDTSSLQQSTIPNGASPNLRVIVPVPICAVDLVSVADLYVGHTRALGTVAINGDAAQLPRRLIDAGAPVVETWMYMNTSNAINNLVIATQPSATAP